MKKIAILGKMNTKYDAPFDDPSWEIWSMNKHDDAAFIPRVDIWFDLHQDETANTYNPDADIKKDDFPFDECHKLLGGRYFNCTASYLIAYAILQGATEIALYGMQFVADHERRHGEYQNVRELIFFTKGKGIKITAPADEIMMKEYIKTEGKDFDQ